MQHILVAGSTGYIGFYSYTQLGEQSSVTSIDFNDGPSEKDSINLDLTDINQVKDLAYNCTHFDVLIFLVGLAHAKGKGKDFPEFKKVNYQTIVNLLSSLEENNKVPAKIIFASSISVYGEKYHQSIYGEDSDTKPFSPYAITKLEAEEYLLNNFSNQSWILRFAPVYSYDFMLNIDRRTKIGNRFYRVGKGFQKLSLCNIDNIIITVEAIINGNVPVGLYNLSDPIEYTYDALLAWRNANGIIRIPLFAVRLLYHLGKIFNNTFLKENTVKLISDNVFLSDKIRLYVGLPSTITNVKLGYD